MVTPRKTTKASSSSKKNVSKNTRSSSQKKSENVLSTKNSTKNSRKSRKKVTTEVEFDEGFFEKFPDVFEGSSEPNLDSVDPDPGLDSFNQNDVEDDDFSSLNKAPAIFSLNASFDQDFLICSSSRNGQDSSLFHSSSLVSLANLSIGNLISLVRDTSWKDLKTSSMNQVVVVFPNVYTTTIEGEAFPGRSYVKLSSGSSLCLEQCWFQEIQRIKCY